jgi:hypothetical protein
MKRRWTVSSRAFEQFGEAAGAMCQIPSANYSQIGTEAQIAIDRRI